MLGVRTVRWARRAYGVGTSRQFRSGYPVDDLGLAFLNWAVQSLTDGRTAVIRVAFLVVDVEGRGRSRVVNEARWVSIARLWHSSRVHWTSIGDITSHTLCVPDSVLPGLTGTAYASVPCCVWRLPYGWRR